jgi:UDP-N-acetylmuramoyl-tripeptide--D-alanyl-D-alanine ligase
MIAMTLAEIARAVGGTLVRPAEGSVAVTGPVAFDSREVEAGSLFAAFAGEHADGHDYAKQAVEAGAVAVLGVRDTGVPTILVGDVEAALGQLAAELLRQLPDIRVIALTGSSGKTSTKDLLAQVLAHHGATVATRKNLNNDLGLPMTVLRADAETRFLVLEMGSRGVGHLARLCRIAQPSIGLVLNIGSAHLGEFGSKEITARAKGELIEAVAPDGLAVLNADDPLVAGMRERSRARVVTFGETERADVRADGIDLRPDGTAAFTLVTGHPAAGDEERHPVALQVVGEHQVANALGAAAVALGAGMAPAAIAAALSAAVPLSGGRMAVSHREDGVTVIDDAYNANPESMRAGLKALAAMARARPEARAWAVLGQMLELGDRADEEHDAIGRLAVRLRIDRLIAVGPGAARIQAGAGHEGSWGEESVMVAEPQEALELLREQVRPGDVVLVKASNSVGLGAVARGLLAADPRPAGGER